MRIIHVIDIITGLFLVVCICKSIPIVTMYFRHKYTNKQMIMIEIMYKTTRNRITIISNSMLSLKTT